MKILSLIIVGTMLSGTLFAIDWNYDSHGPAHWSQLSPEYHLCADGKTQSPIDLTSLTRAEITAPSMSYRSSTGKVADNGHSIQWTPDQKMQLTLNNKTYTLLQIHFHTPSEHLLNGIAFPAEAHLVHQDEKGSLLVIGVFLKSGNSNAFVDNMLSDLQTQKASLLNPAGLLPKYKKILRYNGSLTTPPCTEGVTWVVMQAPVTLSPSQLQALSAQFAGNSRPIQPRNARVILKE